METSTTNGEDDDRAGLVGTSGTNGDDDNRAGLGLSLEESADGPAPVLRNHSSYKGAGAGDLDASQYSEYGTLYENGAHIIKRMRVEFPTGKAFDSKEDFEQAVRTFADTEQFTVRKEGRNAIVCSRAANTSSRKKREGKLTLQKKDTQLSCNCPYGIWWSQKGCVKPTVKVGRIYPYHNHDCNLNSAAASKRKSGLQAASTIQQVTQVLAPYIRSQRPLPCNLIRWTIKPYIASNVVLDSKTIGNIMRSVRVEMDKGNYNIPMPINSDAMSAFTSHDITSSNCAKVLKDLIANSDGESTWIVTRLMMRLAEQDEYFDFKIHYDDNDEADVVTWQIGICRGCFQKYYKHIFLDVRKNENMNTIRMRYMSIIIVDANRQFVPASESFVFEETHELYGIACGFTLEMTPGVTADMVEFGVGDYFLEPKVVKTWFPNITFTVDPFHFCSPKNKHSVLGADFGPQVWGIVKAHFVNATNAATETECLVRCSSLKGVPLYHNPCHLPNYFDFPCLDSYWQSH